MDEMALNLKLRFGQIWSNLLFALYLLLVFITSCATSSSNSIPKLLQVNQVINQTGFYESEELSLSLEVYFEETLIRYKLMDKEGRLLFQSGSPSFSGVHNWGMVLDANRTFWIQSSDIGLYLLKKKDDGYYLESFGMLNSENVKIVPDNVYQLFASSVKRKFPRKKQ